MRLFPQCGPFWPPYPRGEDTPQGFSSEALGGLSWPMPSTHQNRTSLSEEQLRVAVTTGRIPGPPEGRGRAQRLSQVTQGLDGIGYVRGPREETRERRPNRSLEPRPWPSGAIFPHARPGPSLMLTPLQCCPWETFQSPEWLRLTPWARLESKAQGVASAPPQMPLGLPPAPLV